MSDTATPSARQPTPIAAHSARSGSGDPPSADSRIAFMPQGGASSQEIGRTQPGKSESGTRNPQISQTGYSNRLPSAQAVRYRTNETAIRNPVIPIEKTVTRSAAANVHG